MDIEEKARLRLAELERARDEFIKSANQTIKEYQIAINEHRALLGLDQTPQQEKQP